MQIYDTRVIHFTVNEVGSFIKLRMFWAESHC